MISREEALRRARNELALAIHVSETGSTDGIRAIYKDKAEWLSQVVYLAGEALKGRERK